MPIIRRFYRVAFLDQRGEELERVIEVRGVDDLRAEKAARGANVRGPQVDTKTKSVTDMGDFQNMEALKIWAALVRLGHYDAKALAFLTNDYIGSETCDQDGNKIDAGPDDNGTPLDPTQPAESTESV